MKVHRVMLFFQRQPVASFFIFEADISEKICIFPLNLLQSIYSVWRFCVNPVAEKPCAFLDRVRNDRMSKNFIGKSCSKNA